MKLRRFYARNKVVIILLFILFLFILYYLYLHRHPRTDNAFIVANIRPVSAFVPGHITDIYVDNSQRVKKGDKLFTVFTIPYELKVKKLKGDFEAAKYMVDALKGQIKVDELNVMAKLTKFKDAKYLADQAHKLYITRAVSQKSSEELTKKMEWAQVQLEMAKASLNVTQQNLNNSKSQVASLDAELEEAKVNLKLTTVYADSDGIISNMYITKGIYANQGKPLFAFINDEKWWIQANLKETELTNVREGQKVWIKLWLYPEKIFEGVVSKIGWNVNRQMTSGINYLAEVKKENEWFLLPQRFPVQIKINNHDYKRYPLHVGATATVVVDTKDLLWRHVFWNINWW